MKNKGSRFLVVFFLIMTTGVAAAQTPAEKGLAIAREAEQRDSGWKDETSDLTMVLRNRRGEENTRKLHIQTLEVADDGDKSLIVFDEPRDIKGTAFLTYSHKTQEDDQWLYLPALKRVKRIAAVNKTSPFVGSEFSYEDIASQEVEKFSYQWLRDDTLDGRPVFVLQRVPVYEHSGYSREIVWMDKTMYQPSQIEYYDHDNALMKTLIISGYQQYDDRYWRAGSMKMINHQTGKETVLKWENYRFGNGLSDRDFDINTLKRSR